MAKVKATPKSAKENKADVMKWLGLTSEQYTKQYRVFFNKVKNFERITGVKNKQSASYLFHDYAYRKKYIGGEMTGRLNAIISAPASTTTAKISTHAKKVVERDFLKPFAGLIRRSPKFTKALIEQANTPAEAVEFLAAYAAKIRERIKNDRKSGNVFPQYYYED